MARVFRKRGEQGQSHRGEEEHGVFGGFSKVESAMQKWEDIKQER